MGYFIQNNLSFWILARLDVTTFQLVGQLKILFTALLFRLILDKEIGFYQYMAIWQLTCGVAVSQIPRADSTHVDRENSVQGVLATVVFCFLSALAGVYNEKLVKGNKASIHFQNSLLYSWGVVFNLVGVLMNDTTALTSGDSFLHGWNFWTCMLVANSAISGLLISAILKFADNIARVYAASCAVLLTMVASVFILHNPVSPQLVIGVATVFASALQYNVKPEQCGFSPSESSPKARPMVLISKDHDLEKSDDEDVPLSRVSPSAVGAPDEEAPEEVDALISAKKRPGTPPTAGVD